MLLFVLLVWVFFGVENVPYCLLGWFVGYAAHKAWDASRAYREDRKRGKETEDGPGA